MNFASILQNRGLGRPTFRFVRTVAFSAVVCAPVFASPVQARQQSVVIDGQVVEQGTGEAVAGATVELVDGATRITGNDGRFRIAGVTPGRHVLRITALGYRTAEVAVIVTRDTGLLIELEVVPISLDTLQVASRTVTVQGQVKDAETGIGLIDVEVEIRPNHEGVTDPVGRYKLERIPAGARLALTVRGFGYLPVMAEFEAERDTTMDFGLELDPIAQRMIADQVVHLETRAAPLFTAGAPSITREDLMRRINWNVLDIIKDRYGRLVDRIGCILIDEVQTYRGIGELALMLPDRFERIELLYRGAMLRLYTRDFMRRMSGGAIELRKPYVAPGLCR